MESKPRKSAVPFYAVALLWLVYALFFPLYRPVHYLLMAVVSLILFFGLDQFCRGGEVIGGHTAEEKKKEKPKQEKPTGNPELDKAVKDVHLAVGEMKRLDENISDVGVSADIVRMEELSEAILQAVRQDPKKLPQIRRFMDYYLPTTLKLLNSYDRMSTTGASGENIGGTLEKVEGILRTIVAAFEKQLDALYRADAMDISADISVLETMLASEGLTGSEMKPDDKQFNPNDIKLEL